MPYYWILTIVNTAKEDLPKNEEIVRVLMEMNLQSQISKSSLELLQVTFFFRIVTLRDGQL